MSRNYRFFLEDIIESCDKILLYTKGLSYAGFKENNEKVDAVIRNFEVIGEAARQLPSSLKENYPKVDWVSIIGMRNRMIHHYFGVDLEVMWDAVKTEVPQLRLNILQILTNQPD